MKEMKINKPIDKEHADFIIRLIIGIGIFILIAILDYRVSILIETLDTSNVILMDTRNRIKSYQPEPETKFIQGDSTVSLIDPRLNL